MMMKKINYENKIVVRIFLIFKIFKKKLINGNNFKKLN